MRFDLHIHSCLSPCANLEMSPSEIVARAKAAGLGGMALTDHQSARNCPAIAECARRAGIGCLFGLEVQTVEEVHTVALFDTVDQALGMTDFVYAALPKRVNDPDTFGDQPVVTWDDDIVELEWRILAMGCRLTIPEVAAKVHGLGGLYIAAHVDRPNFSVLGALGTIPEPLPGEVAVGTRYFDAVELSRTANEADWLGKIGDYAVVRSSDAHNLDDVALVWTEAELPDGSGGESLSVATLSRAFAERSTKPSPRLDPFAL